MWPQQPTNRTSELGELHFIVPGAIDRPTGGSRYDREIVQALRDIGQPVRVYELSGHFPGPDRTAAVSLSHTLTSIADGQTVLIDGLVLGGLPECLQAHRNRLRLIAILHHPLCLETGLTTTQAATLEQLERDALASCHYVIATSMHTKNQLHALNLYRGPIAAIQPGCEPGPLNNAPSSDTLHFICVGSLTPRKGQDVLLNALQQCPASMPPWHCQLIGSTDLAPEYAPMIAQIITRYGLEERVTITGPLSAEQLLQAYGTADCLILPSRYEGYGMVVSEAMAHGLPVITTTAGALADTLPPDAGLAVAPDDAAALSQAIQQFMADAQLREALREGARAARNNLVPWSARAKTLLATLKNTTHS